MPPHRKHVVLNEEQRKLADQYRGLVLKIAGKFYRGFIPEDIIGEGNVGLCVAAGRFDKSRHVLFSTYATYWIRAYILEHIIRNYAPVRMGSTQRERKAFFGIARASHVVGNNAEAIAERIGIDEDTVRRMQVRFYRRDVHIDAPRSDDDDRGFELPDDDAVSPETVLVDDHSRAMVQRALNSLSPRERRIIQERFFGDDSKTLGDIGRALGISRERVRQIEVKAIDKMRAMLRQ